MIVGICLWYAVSQLPLHVLTGAVLAGRHHRATAWMRSATARWSALARQVVTVLILAGATLLTADAIVFLATGSFLIA